MRSDLQLIQSAIADFDFSANELMSERIADCNFFKTYTIRLPAKFKGLPAKWHFAILPQQGDERHNLASKAQIIEDGNQLIAAFISKQKLPLVIISDDIRFNTSTELGNIDSAVFFLNKNYLPGKMGAAKAVRDTPIIVAAKNKLEEKNYPLYLSPYAPNIPVKGWQFFGRQKELNLILSSKANCFILGARKMGKTSILLEAERQLDNNGFSIHHIGVQYLRTFGEVVNAMVSKLSSRDAYYAQRDTDYLDTNFIANVIKRLKGEDKKKIVIVFDELGNVMRKDPRNAWNFIGVLRELSHNGEVRILASAFQEVYIRTYKDPDSPLLNFGTMINIHLFSKSEVEELLINPLSVWYQVEDKEKLISQIRKKFGFHPLILQYLGEYIFKNIFNSNDKRVSTHLHKLFATDIVYFKQAYEEIYESNHSLLERYVYLKCCRDTRELGRELSALEFKQANLDELLKKFNLESSLDERSYFLFRLSLKGLFYQDESNGLIFKIATPIIYYYIYACNDVNELILDYEIEILKSVNNIKIDYQNEGS